MNKDYARFVLKIAWNAGVNSFLILLQAWLLWLLYDWAGVAWTVAVVISVGIFTALLQQAADRDV